MNLTITLKQPMTEKCNKCDYEAFYSFSSSHCNCPKCGAENSVNRVYHRSQAVYVFLSRGSYDFCHPADKQWCYRFFNLPDGYKNSFVVDDEIDVSDPLECAGELKEIISKYLVNSSKKKINKVYQYLEENEDEQYKLRIFDKKRKLERELYELYYKNQEILRAAPEEISEAQKQQPTAQGVSLKSNDSR